MVIGGRGDLQAVSTGSAEPVSKNCKPLFHLESRLTKKWWLTVEPGKIANLFILKGVASNYVGNTCLQVDCLEKYGR
jgi:hypothetical protein